MFDHHRHNISCESTTISLLFFMHFTKWNMGKREMEKDSFFFCFLPSPICEVSLDMFNESCRNKNILFLGESEWMWIEEIDWVGKWFEGKKRTKNWSKERKEGKRERKKVTWRRIERFTSSPFSGRINHFSLSG